MSKTGNRISGRLLLLLSTNIFVIAGYTQPAANRNPDIGYVYPAGGQRGTTFEILVGGQFIKAASGVRISGDGVTAELIQTYRPRRNLMKEQRELLRETLRKLRDKRLLESADTENNKNNDDAETGETDAEDTMTAMVSMTVQEQATENDQTQLPEHPLLRNLESKSLKELQHIQNAFFDFTQIRKKQPNSQLAEMALINVTLAADATPGDRELRLITPLGVTDPMCFQVGTLPEAKELEPNDPRPYRKAEDEPLVLPVVVNGQIMPGDVDRIRFKANKGQKLVIETYARHLVPFLADAVPGWFQATVSIYDKAGKELAFADDYQFHPDPVLFFVPPKDGIFELEIRDAIYRGREDFVYRIAIGELPFITEIFPLGGQVGAKTVSTIRGWNLKQRRLRLDTAPGIDTIRTACTQQGGMWTNSLPYAVGSLPECLEQEPNNKPKAPQDIEIPVIVNGQISRPGDMDCFRFEGHQGDLVVLEVVARRLHSPMDALLKLLDAKGNVVAWNDDYMLKDGHLHPDMGILTHHADPYLNVTLPKTGAYLVQITDTTSHGSTAHAYRLRVSKPQPDFDLKLSPSNIVVQAGRPTPITIHALRKDGFDGPIQIALADAPEGLRIDGGAIPEGRDNVQFTLTPSQDLEPAIMPLKIVGSAVGGEAKITRPAHPVDDVMQAFLWRHLAPCRELLLTIRKARWNALPAAVVENTPVKVPMGGTATVRISTTRYLKGRHIDVELRNAAEGVSVGSVTCENKSMKFDVAVDGEAIGPGFVDNLIMEAFMEMPIRAKGDEKSKTVAETAPKTRRVSLGILPAIPIEVAKAE